MQKENIIFNTPSLPLNIRRLKMDKDSYYRDLHFHSAIELVYVNKGEVICHIGDEKNSLSAGDIILINKGIVHKLTTPELANITYVHINIDEFLENSLPYTEKYIYSFIKSTASKEYYVSKSKGELLKVYNEIISESSQKNTGYEMYLKSYISLLVGFMYRNKLLTDFAASYNIKKIYAIMPSVRYINDNFSQKLSLSEIAKKSNKDKFGFCRLFKSATGSTVFEYINYVRIHIAKEQLLETEKSISEIAFDCGFASLQYFNRTFKRYCGCTPKKYREQYCKHIV